MFLTLTEDLRNSCQHLWIRLTAMPLVVGSLSAPHTSPCGTSMQQFCHWRCCGRAEQAGQGRCHQSRLTVSGKAYKAQPQAIHALPNPVPALDARRSHWLAYEACVVVELY